MIADKTFLRFIEVQVADEYDAGSHNHWRITIYNGTAQDSTQLCHTNFMRYKYLIIFHWKYEFITKLLRFSFFIKKLIFTRKYAGVWERGKYSQWARQKHLGQCFNYPLNTKNLPSFISVRFTVGDRVLINNEIKVSTRK